MAQGDADPAAPQAVADATAIIKDFADLYQAALRALEIGPGERLTVRDLGRNKYFTVAQALVALGAHSS